MQFHINLYHEIGNIKIFNVFLEEKILLGQVPTYVDLNLCVLSACVQIKKKTLRTLNIFKTLI